MCVDMDPDVVVDENERMTERTNKLVLCSMNATKLFQAPTTRFPFSISI